MSEDFTPPIEKAEELGYSCPIAYEGHVTNPQDNQDVWVWIPTVYSVSGNGISTQVRADDEDAWTNLINPAVHENRVLQVRHNDPNDDFTMTDRERYKSSLKAAVGAKTMTKDEAKEALVSYDKAQEEATA